MTTRHITTILVVVLLFNSSALCRQPANRSTALAAQSSNPPDQPYVAFIEGNSKRYLPGRLAAMTQSKTKESDLTALAVLAQQPKRKSVATRRPTAPQAPPAKRLATNADIIKMSRAKVDEIVILAYINAHESKFDVSSDGIVSLQQAGVSRTVLTAIINAGTPANRIAPAPTPIAVPTAPPAVRPKSVDLDRVAQPFAGLESKQGIQPLKQGAVQVADTKAKGESLSDVGKQAAALGGATVLIQNTPAILGLPQFMAIPVIGVIMPTLIGKFYKPKFTRIFGLKNPASEQVVPTKPRFLVMFAKVETENLDAFEPRLVKLVPVQGQWRLAFAQRVQKDEFELSDHIEETVGAKVTRLDKGKFSIEPNTELAPGEYALVLRPTKKLPRLTEKAMKNGRMGDYQLATYLVDFSVQ